MRKSNHLIMMFITVFIMVTAFAGCSRDTNSPNSYGMEQFENAMKDKGYNFEIEDVKRDFLPTKRERMIIDDKAIDIYIFTNGIKMEKEASHIGSEGCSYENGSIAMNVSWISYPHFYKRGSLIVQYVGEDENIISDLTDILGEQFAGEVK